MVLLLLLAYYYVNTTAPTSLTTNPNSLLLLLSTLFLLVYYHSLTTTATTLITATAISSAIIVTIECVTFILCIERMIYCWYVIIPQLVNLGKYFPFNFSVCYHFLWYARYCPRTDSYQRYLPQVPSPWCLVRLNKLHNKVTFTPTFTPTSPSPTLTHAFPTPFISTPTLTHIPPTHIHTHSPLLLLLLLLILLLVLLLLLLQLLLLPLLPLVWTCGGLAVSL